MRGYQDQSQRIRPNVFALLARLCFRNASFVLLFWVFVSAVSLVFALGKIEIDTNAPTHFSKQNAAANDLAEQQKNFPEQASLFEISVLSETSAERKKTIDFLNAAVEQRTDLFRFGFSPGAGPYYEKYGLLHLPSAQLAQRVEILRAQAPLFRAIAASPNLDGLTLLVNQVEASIALDRQPEGLERLFSEAALTVRSVLQGSASAVDWRKVAHINVENTSRAGVILIAPQVGLEREASVLIEKLASEIESATRTKLSRRYPASINAIANELPVRAISAGFAIFLFLFCLIITGELRLTVMIVLPTFATISLTAGVVGLFHPEVSPPFFGPILSAVLGTLFLAATQTVNLAQTSHLAGRWETVGMLTAQKHGLALVLQFLAVTVFWSCWLIWRDSETTLAIVLLVGSQVIALLSCFTIIPALCQFMIGQDQWRYQDFRQNFEKILHGWKLPEVFAIAICAGLFWVFLFPTWLPQGPTKAATSVAPIQIIVQTEKTARELIADFSKISGVTAARWLGAFLPPETAKTYLNSNSFADLFPAANFSAPTGFEDANPERVANLESSLRAISDAKNISPDLRATAHEFRRSVSLLAATGQNIDIAVVQLENLLFTRFDELHSTIVALADPKPLKLTDLDPSLQALFRAKNGDFRIEIETAPAFSLLDFQQKMRNSDARLISQSLAENVEVELRRINLIWAALLGLALSIVVYGLISDRVSTWGIAVLSLGLAVISLYIIRKPITAYAGAESHHVFALAISSLVAIGAGLCATSHSSQEGPYSGLNIVIPAVLLAGIASLTLAYVLIVPNDPSHILLVSAAAVVGAGLIVFASLHAAFSKYIGAGL